MFDVIVVGGGVAGTSCALGFARAGCKVLLLDKKASDDSYKALCTHFVQPLARAALQKLALEDALHTLGVATKAAFWTSAGWIDPPGDYGLLPGGQDQVAFNIERRQLDPLLIQTLRREASAELRLGAAIVNIHRAPEGHYRIAYEVAATRFSAEAKLLVAADGRSSTTARLLGAPLEGEAENQRICSFAYFDGVPAPPLQRSLFYLGEQRMAFLYPLTEGRALLSAYVPKALAHELSEREDGRSLLRVFEQLPDAPPLRQARLASRHLGYTDYPNRWRSPTHDGVAFVGDAALSLDPMSGVGCAFGLHSADLLVTHTAAALRDGTSSDLAHGLGEYERSFRAFFAPHAKGIVADSLVAKSAATIANVYGRVVQHPELQRHFIALTGRLITPGAFQKAFLSAGSPRRAASMHRSETP